MENTIEILRMDDPVRTQVEAYVYKNYKSLNGKTLIIKDMGSHFQVLKHKDGSPLILGKSILG